MERRIRDATRFREVVSLRDEVWSLSGKIDMSDFLALRDRVEKKVVDLDQPMFENIGIEIIFPDGSRKAIDQREVRLIVGKGKRLSEYVFSNYSDAIDYELKSAALDDSAEMSPELGEGLAEFSVSERAMRAPGLIKESIQRIVRLALKLATLLCSTYSKAYPNIAADLQTIRERLEQLLERVSGSLYY